MNQTSIPPQRSNKATSSRRYSLKVLDQHLAPHGLLTRLMYRATRIRTLWFKRWQINWFIRRYGVDMSIAEQVDLEAYPDFNTFFIRALRTGARPLPNDPKAMVCPVDGVVSQAGRIEQGRLYQAKGHGFTLPHLLGGAKQYAEMFNGGIFATLYLSPKDYHRVHMPCDGTLRGMTYVPGKLFSVAPRTTENVHGLFARNERLIMLFDTACGPMAVIMVGAMFVAGMETVWTGLVCQTHCEGPRHWNFEERAEPLFVARGDEIGRFNMGSTVIVLLPPDCAELAPEILPNVSVRMGQTFASLTRK